VTGTLGYPEPARLSADAVAVVVLVRGTATPAHAAIVGSQVIPNPGQVPIAFLVPYATAEIEPGVTYTIQAVILDGDLAWATSQGVPVITKGAPSSGLTITLAYRPDLVKGQVTGVITGVGITTSPGTYSVATVIDLTSGATIGIDVNQNVGAIPVPFAVPYSPETIDAAHNYVVDAEIVDATRTWSNPTGVPVLTNGNTSRDVVVTVTESGVPAPGPSVSPTPGDGGGAESAGRDFPIIFLLLLLLIGAAAVALWLRPRGSGPVPPGSAPPAAAATADTSAAGDSVGPQAADDPGGPGM
jgi:uncharacterized lipoprotein YbaY